MKLLAFSLVLFFVTGCQLAGDYVKGNGEIRSQNVPVSRFDKLIVSGPMDVEIRRGDSYKVEVETDENVLAYVEIENRGDRLEVGLRDNVNIRSSTIKVVVQAPGLSMIKLAGSGKVRTAGQISDPNKIDLSVSGSGDMFLDLNTPFVDGTISGSGKITVSGQTKKLGLRVTGSGDFYGEELKSEEATIKVTGSGKAIVFASMNLDVSITGSGDVRYHGSPEIRQRITGSGSVRSSD